MLYMMQSCFELFKYLVKIKNKHNWAKYLPAFLGTEVMTTEAITTVTEGAAESSSPAEPEKVYAVQLEDGQIVHMSQQDVDQGLPAGIVFISFMYKAHKNAQTKFTMLV